jgi:hypothetical protein
MTPCPALLSLPEYDYALIDHCVPSTHKTRRHHNNDGRRQVRRGKTRQQVKRMARRLGIRYAVREQ